MNPILKDLLDRAFSSGFSNTSTNDIKNIEDAYKAIGTDLEVQLIYILRNMLGETKVEKPLPPPGRILKERDDPNEIQTRDPISGNIVFKPMCPGFINSSPDTIDSSSNKPIEMRPLDPKKLQKFRNSITAILRTRDETPFLPPRYNGCTCHCHRVPGIKHVVACCRPKLID